MKKLFLILLLMTGCASSRQKASDYCDANWKGRFNTWESCYYGVLPDQNKGLKLVGAALQGGGQGLQDVKRTTMYCTQWGNQITCR